VLLSQDQRAEFPEMRGLSTSNLNYMRYFGEHCPARQFGQQPAAQLPWFHVAPLLSGKAKAMVVVASRVEAVRWQLAIDKYIKTKGYPLRTLVAFSGAVADPESGPEEFTESSKLLNPNLNGREMRKAFDTDEYQILLVANKFQTGFDQPLLCGMYVDKRLAGIQAVQTLSRLNRAHPGKDTT
jgi:type I restriction enzyme R subunit